MWAGQILQFRPYIKKSMTRLRAAKVHGYKENPCFPGFWSDT